MKRDARQAILDAGAELVHRQGFNNTGIKEILDAAGVPKGSFYFYFPSKEAFGLALIEHYRAASAAASGRLLADASVPPLDRLRNFFAGVRGRFADWGCERGCPFGNLAQELADLSPEMRKSLQGSLDAMSERIAGLLREAAERGDLPAGLDPDDTAAFVMDAWEGAILRMKTQKNVEPLLRFERLVCGSLLGMPVPGNGAAGQQKSDRAEPAG
ncbi:transcriptional regulator, TetR family [Desulfovibrio sp. X2]|uniref:TetR/AcrR family transcriptional regulator n=1 Tax=Desulfovibrio sp. X2 TaxID=941449 RepID=UPI000358767A|nr:TetR/AcrR family transcriptional regulator [Desulfovibrio sp. X2]EPR37095.1 transcriptional regulator, TetR family [Desulfovibrio sp. X2]